MHSDRQIEKLKASIQKYGIIMPVLTGTSSVIIAECAMLGEKPEVFEKVRLVLEAMGSGVVLCGGIGAENVTKLCNQAVAAINIAAVSEALMLGKKAGANPEAIYQAIR